MEGKEKKTKRRWRREIKVHNANERMKGKMEKGKKEGEDGWKDGWKEGWKEGRGTYGRLANYV